MKDLEQLYETVKKRNPNDKEFLQAVEEVFESLNIITDVHPEELDDDVLERFVEPERQIIFRVPWVDDNGKTQVNGGLTLAHSQNSQMSFMYGFFSSNFYFLLLYVL
ncbi:MAG: hypothetical protein ACLTL6_00180 [Holdemanella porci]